MRKKPMVTPENQDLFDRHISMLEKIDNSKWVEAPKDDAEFVERLVHQQMGGWIPIHYWYEWSGETPKRIQKRLFDGAWVRGVHWTRPLSSEPWVNLYAIREWLLKQRPPMNQPPPEEG